MGWLKRLTILFVGLSLTLGLTGEVAVASDWWRGWGLESNYGNIEAISPFLLSANVIDNNGNPTGRINYNANSNIASFTQMIGGLAEVGHTYEPGSGWRYRVVTYARDGSTLVGVYSHTDQGHTNLTIYLGNGINLTVNINAGGLIFSAEQIAEVMRALEAGDFTQVGDKGLEITIGGNKYYVTVESISFSAGWVRSALADGGLENDIKAVLDKYGLEMATLNYTKDVDGDGDRDIYDAIQDTFLSYKAPLNDEQNAILLAFENKISSLIAATPELVEFANKFLQSGSFDTMLDKYTTAAYRDKIDWDGDGDVDADDATKYDSLTAAQRRERVAVIIFESLYKALFTLSPDKLKDLADGKTITVLEIDLDGDKTNDITITLEKTGAGDYDLNVKDIKNSIEVHTTIPNSIFNQIKATAEDYHNPKGWAVSQLTVVGASLKIEVPVYKIEPPDIDWSQLNVNATPAGYMPGTVPSTYLTNINFTGNLPYLINKYKGMDWSKYRTTIDWDNDGDVDANDATWYDNNNAENRTKAVFRELVLKPFYRALANGTLTVGGPSLKIDLDGDGTTDIEMRLVAEGEGARVELKDNKFGTTTPWMNKTTGWIYWRHIPKSERQKIENKNNKTIADVDWTKLWGDPALTGTLSYDEATGTGKVTMTVNVWSDEFGKVHVNQDYWDSLSEEEQQAIIAAAGGEENIDKFSGTLTVELDLSDPRLSEEDRQAIIDAAKNGEIYTLHGIGPTELEDRDTIVVLGLGKGPFEYHPFG